MTIKRRPLDPRIHHGEWNDDLKCYLKAIIPIDSDKVLLYLAADNCCDMNGAIKISTAILPRVRWIETWVGEDEDVLYRKGLDNTWRSLESSAPVRTAAKAPAKTARR